MLQIAILTANNACNVIHDFQRLLNDGICYGCPTDNDETVIVQGQAMIMCNDDFKANALFYVEESLIFYTNYDMSEMIEFSRGELRFSRLDGHLYIVQANLEGLLSNAADEFMFVSDNREAFISVGVLDAFHVIVAGTEMKCDIIKALSLVFTKKSTAIVGSMTCETVVVQDESTLKAHMAKVDMFTIASFVSVELMECHEIDLGKNSILLSLQIEANLVNSAANSAISARTCLFKSVSMVNEIRELFSKLECTDSLEIEELVATDFTNVTSNAFRVLKRMHSHGTVMAGMVETYNAVIKLYRTVIIESLRLYNSSALLLCECPELHITDISLYESDMEAENIVLETATLQNSSIHAERLEVALNISAQDGSEVDINSLSVLTTALFDITSSFTTGSLRIRYNHGFNTARIPNLSFRRVVLNVEYFKIIEALGNSDIDSEAFNHAFEELEYFNGTLVIDSACSLITTVVNASAVVANGRLIRYQDTSDKAPDMYINYIFCEFFPYEIHIDLIVFNNVNTSLAYLRLCRTLEISALQLYHTQLLINRNEKEDATIFTYEITVRSSFLLDSGSVIWGQFSLQTEKLRMYEIRQIYGHFEVADERIYSSEESSIIMGQLRLDVPNEELQLLGSIASITNNIYEPSIIINAKSLQLGNASAQCDYSAPYRHTCCGGSMRNFGGCSYGTPHSLVFTDKIEYLHPIEGIPGDSCRSSRTTYPGGNGGGFILINAYEVVFKRIDASGVPSILNSSDNGCGGSGAGGYVEIQAQDISGGMVLVNGGNCQKECASGGAGSAGVIVVNQKTISPSNAETFEFMIEENDGICKYPVINSQRYCRSLMKLNSSKMTCSIPIWLTLTVMLVGSIIIAGIVSASVNLVTGFRNKYA